MYGRVHNDSEFNRLSTVPAFVRRHEEVSTTKVDATANETLCAGTEIVVPGTQGPWYYAKYYS